MKLSLDVTTDADLDKHIVHMVRHRVESALSGAEMRTAIDAAAQKAVEARVGAILKTLVQGELRQAVERHVSTRLKGVAVQALIREIVTDLFKDRFGKPKETDTA